MTLFNGSIYDPESNYDSLTARTVAFPVKVVHRIQRVVAPTELMNHVNFDQKSGDMAVGSCGLVAIRVSQSVSNARLHDQSSCKVGVRPLLTEPGTRQRHS